MATEINDIGDLVRIVEEHPEWRGELQRVLLTQALLDLPETMTARLGGIEKGLDDMKEELKEDIGKLENILEGEQQAQSSFRGAHAQSAANKQDSEIAVLFADVHGLNRNKIKTRYVSRSVLEQWVDDYEDELLHLDLKQEGALRKFQRPDIIAVVFDSPAGQMKPAFYIAVEASYSGEKKDVDKATDNAKILRAVTGLEAYPVVASVRLHRRMDEESVDRLYEDVDQLIAAGDPDAALWYRLDSDDLRPTEPQ